jgi:translation initiation factor IF-3
MAHRDIGYVMIDRLITELSEVGLAEARPRQEGRFLHAIIGPKKVPGKSSGGGQKAAARAAAPVAASSSPTKESSGG